MVICHLHETISHLKSIIFKYKLKLFHRICISIIWDFSNIQTQHHKHLQPELFVLGLLLLFFFFSCPAFTSHPHTPPILPIPSAGTLMPLFTAPSRRRKKVWKGGWEAQGAGGGGERLVQGLVGAVVDEVKFGRKTEVTRQILRAPTWRWKKKKNLPSNKEKKQEETRVSWRLNTGIKMFTAEHHGPFCTINFFFPLRTEGFWWLFVFPQW